MRNAKTFFKDIATKLPVVFPLVAFFHVVLFIWTLRSLAMAPATTTEISTLWMLAYTACWVATADARKWGAMGYIIVTVGSILIYLTATERSTWITYESPIFILDILFCFFIMFYYKRFR